MDVRLLFPSLYIGAADLRGKDVTLTIERLKVDDLRTDKGTEKKPVIYFREMEARHRQGKGENKRLVLNKTNATVVAQLYGHETDNWRGKRITLYATTCNAFGKIVDCIRVRDQAPRGKTAAAPEPPAEEETMTEFDEVEGL